MKRTVILGSTGSIGKAAVEIAGKYPDRFDIRGLAAGRNAEVLAGQLSSFPEAGFSVRDEETLSKLMLHDPSLGRRCMGTGQKGIKALLDQSAPDLVINSLVGISGLLPTVASLERGCDVALANKESLVAAGGILMEMSAKNKAAIIPVDSEHFSLSRCLEGNRKKTREIILTASGGPFLNSDRSSLEAVSVDEVLDHPTWNMGRRITVDSAHLINKGFEVIEAFHLFGFPLDRIKVVVHPQSIVHSMIRMNDGSLLAHLGPADMRLPLMNAMYYPDIGEYPWQELRIEDMCKLEFKALKKGIFPGFDLAMEAARRGGTAPVVLNAADEVAVSSFLSGKIGFMTIIEWIEDTLSAHNVTSAGSIDEIMEADRWARAFLEEKHGISIAL